MSSPIPSECRLLTAQDVADFRALRLRALNEVPEAFLEDYDEIAALPPDHYRRMILDGWVFGAFIDGALAAVAGMYRHKGRKVSHKATIWGVYTAPHMQGKGLSRRLLHALIELAREQKIELIQLSTDEANAVSQGLYRSLGFEPYGVEKHILKIGERYVSDVMMVKFL